MKKVMEDERVAKESRDRYIPLIENHVDPVNHARLVTAGIWSSIWGEKTIRKIIIGVFFAGILAIFGLSLPYQQILERLNAILGLIGKM